MRKRCSRSAAYSKNRSIFRSIIFIVTIYLLLISLNSITNILYRIRIYTSPEYHQTETFQRRTQADYDYLPLHCQPIAKHFDYCQDRHSQQQSTIGIFSKNIQSYNPITPIIVFACHRKWCHAYFGHCEPCSGLGERYVYLLSQIDSLLSMTISEMNRPDRSIKHSVDDYTCYAKVQIDAPTNGLRQMESTLYVDPGGWFSEFVHSRSYSVSDRQLLPYHNILRQQTRRTHRRPQRQQLHYYYTHFMPLQYGLTNDFNACYFHMLYQPDDQLRRDIEYQRNNILRSASSTLVIGERKNNELTTIGIHYLTGDTAPYSVQNVSVANQLISGWNTMYDCSIKLMQQLLFQQDDYVNGRLYLSTDSPTIREHVQQYYAYGSNASTSLPFSILPFVPVHVTDSESDSSLRRNSGDRSDLLELYLLSGCDGIVVNVLPTSGYESTILPISPFAALARKIGFVPNSNFYKCIIH